ncbi:ATP phosphoribosyltransferase regulatory subunit [Mobilisporobacter senegalensis]|uniref:ATP phosphoribosyltransferase regulatory subunit n=1 Tax=Mobilisporobacter senegalensis TaxID=1329262 RepID=A0A3N1XRS6_9FIRM|nr:ATP phosphoribosyltransferase regulatory subunit [Mobilisporobacter senegalensis]ROR29336.1 ATP phosphoribosyltransferase regulatory subunit [Mobilisporobacter senegalensis]
MIEKILHTPEGVRDIYNSECQRKLLLENNMHQVMSLYGFKDIQTPTFEFFDIFNKERGTIASKEMYKFFDRDGNTLVLRPDITPSIARCAAKYYKDEKLPIRLCYTQNTFINNTSYQGKLKETTQLGAELINDDTVEADAEMIALTISCLLDAGLKEFQLEIGQADFFKGLAEEAKFEEEEVEQLRILIENKNLFGVEALVSSKDITKELKEVFLQLPKLFGNIENLISAKTMTKNERALKAIERLEELYDILVTYGYGDYVTFDLGMLSKYNYYTGIIFRAYTYGTGDAIATGGRYDNLVRQFGKDAPAIGVAIVTNQLMIALSRQKIEIPIEDRNTLILYETDYRSFAINLATHFRNDGMNVELLLKNPVHDIQDYMNYGKVHGIGGVLYIKEDNLIKVIDLQTDTIKDARFKDFE